MPESKLTMRTGSPGKVRHFFDILKRPLFVEDSGFYIEEFGGRPGSMVKQTKEAFGPGRAGRAAHVRRRLPQARHHREDAGPRQRRAFLARPVVDLRPGGRHDDARGAPGGRAGAGVRRVADDVGRRGARRVAGREPAPGLTNHRSPRATWWRPRTRWPTPAWDWRSSGRTPGARPSRTRPR